MRALIILLYLFLILVLLAIAIFFIAIYALRRWILIKKAKIHKGNNDVNVGIFHPYCNAGGGGERVLWCAVRALQAKYDNVKIIIYTGDIDASPNTILNKAEGIFNVAVDQDNISFVYLKKRHWVEAQMYPYFTLLGQSIGSLILGLEGLAKFPPDVYIDTMGYAFTLPLFRFLGQCKVGCYVHFPTISTDMLRLYLFLILVLLAIAIFFIAIYALRRWILIKKAKIHKGNNDVNVGIFHPYCNAGGGGERVLWCAVRALQAKYDNVKIIIYTGDIDASPNTILNKAEGIFNVAVDQDNISFVYLKKRHWVEAQMYPYFTLLGQSIGSLILGLEGLAKFPPDVYIDTMGYAFTLPLFRFLGQCKVGCYVHFPTISTDMLRLYLFLILVLLAIAIFFIAIYALRRWILIKKAKIHKGNNDVNVGIFHPYCNAGGGGERVLWCAVRALQAKYDNVKIIIYTGDIDASPNTILNKAEGIFNVAVDQDNISFVYLKKRHWVEAQMYPYITLLGQSIGSLILGLEGLAKFPPDVYIDTMGYAFTLPLFRFLGQCKVGCYVHFPTISTDMLRLYLFLILVLLAIAIFFIAIYALRRWILIKKAKIHKGNNDVNVGIFHPYCNAGGGGERVLWCAVRALQAKYDNVKIIIYTGDIDASPNTILNKAEGIFNVAVDQDNISFVYLKKRHWVEAQMYPYFTLLGQSIGSLILGLEGLAKFPPDVYIDTMGYAFTLPLFRFLGQCKVGCYVHFPTISTDMLRRVRCREYSHNNQAYVARNPFFTWAKLTYYKIFSKIYSWVGCRSLTIMVNSTWTENHILDLWNAPFKTHRVYPPCEVSHLKTLPFTGNDDQQIVILSVGQFRPEKDHPLQLRALYELRTLLNKDEELWSKTKLIIAGSCRHEEDYVRLKNMQDFSKHLSLENNVEFKVNVSYKELIQLYQSARIGLHTMWNEHFGISIVECMAAGLIMVANRSGGPLLDIIETSEGSQNGYLAVEAVEYANCFMNILYNTKEENEAIRNAARSSVERFSEKEFEVNFLRAVSPLFTKTD